MNDILSEIKIINQMSLYASHSVQLCLADYPLHKKMEERKNGDEKMTSYKSLHLIISKNMKNFL